MKNYSIILTIILAFFLCSKGFSQDSLGCGTQPNTVGAVEPSRGLTCSYSGTDYITKYRTP